MLKNAILSMLSLHFSQLGGTLWFLRALLITILLYAGIEFFLRKYIIKQYKRYITHIIISIFLIYISYMWKERNILTFTFIILQCFSCYSIFIFGVLIRHIRLNLSYLYFFIAILSSFIALLYFYNDNIFIELSQNIYTTPIHFIACSILGWIFIYCISKILTNIYIISHVLSYIGMYSLYILILHFLVFKVVNMIVIRIYNMPNFMIAAFPTLYNNDLWWVIYCILGIACPLFCVHIAKKLSSILRKYLNFHRQM